MSNIRTQILNQETKEARQQREIVRKIFANKEKIRQLQKETDQLQSSLVGYGGGNKNPQLIHPQDLSSLIVTLEEWNEQLPVYLDLNYDAFLEAVLSKVPRQKIFEQVQPAVKTFKLKFDSVQPTVVDQLTIVSE